MSRRVCAVSDPAQPFFASGVQNSHSRKERRGSSGGSTGLAIAGVLTALSGGRATGTGTGDPAIFEARAALVLAGIAAVILRPEA